MEMWEELMTCREAYRVGRMNERDWLAKRDSIIHFSNIAEHAPDKPQIDSILQCIDLKNNPIQLNHNLHTLAFTMFKWDPSNLEERAAKTAYLTKKKGLEKIFGLIKNTSLDLPARLRAASCLWAYGELDFQRRRAAKHGALECIYYMLGSPEPRLVEKSLGILWGYLEYEDAQERVISNGAVPLISNLIGNPSCRQLSVLGCLFNISSNGHCRPHIIYIIPRLLSNWNEKENVDIGYFRCLILAQMLNDERLNLTEYANSIGSIFSHFLSTYTPQQMRQEEEEGCYSWVSLLPFLKLTFSPNEQIQQLGLFSLANLTTSGLNQKLLQNQQLTDNVLAAALCHPCSYSQQILINYKKYPIPSLKSIIQAKFPSLRDKQLI
eukprot:TRINITY_DN24247_c0_g1_i1.p1 TRINITY_DN24247_c0_g1~~TRINITY_DN24247_c0_g1_i1.p1  ORF type:complete len:380 (+),score=87.38 TRINITY_DN24247_c0_g1_i1:40-1179(+)